MTPFEIEQLIIQSLGFGGLIYTITVYSKQHSTMEEQLNTMKEQHNTARQASVAQNLLTIASFLQSSEFEKACTDISVNSFTHDFNSRGTEALKATNKICSTYDIVSIMVKSGMFPLETIVGIQGPSIRRCYEALKDKIPEMKRLKNFGASDWKYFEWLYNEVIKQSKSGSG